MVIDRSGIPGDTRCHSVTREQRRALLELLRDFTVEIQGFRPIAEAIVTSGGVSLKEVDPRTMESKLVRGLYIAGELLDADAYTGGYNLQIAFATGRCARQPCRERLNCRKQSFSRKIMGSFQKSRKLIACVGFSRL